VRRHRRQRAFRWLELVFWCLAALALGAYAYVYLDRSVYQSYREWAFDRELEGKAAPVMGFVLHSIGAGEEKQPAPPADRFEEFARKAEPTRPQLEPDALIGRIEVPRLGIRAIIVQGTTNRALRRAVGHIEGTALPGESGNVGIAGHRDTFFRGLRQIRKDDVVLVRTLDATYSYSVDSIQVVDPEDTWVLKASGSPGLTLVTCYPFDYIGSAPRRYVVHARQTGGVTPAPVGQTSACPPAGGARTRQTEYGTQNEGGSRPSNQRCREIATRRDGPVMLLEDAGSGGQM
jgi:sortase A